MFLAHGRGGVEGFQLLISLAGKKAGQVRLARGEGVEWATP